MVSFHVFSTHGVKALLSSLCPSPFYPTPWDWPYWLSCQNIAPSFDNLANFIFIFPNLDINNIQIIFLSHLYHNSMHIDHLTIYLSNFIIKPFEMRLPIEIMLFFKFQTWRTWVMVVRNILPPTWIIVFMLPLPMTCKLCWKRTKVIIDYEWNVVWTIIKFIYDFLMKVLSWILWGVVFPW